METREYLIRNARNGARLVLGDRIAKLSTGFLMFVLVLAVIGPTLSPYPYDQYNYNDDGEVTRLASPSLDHPLGTDNVGRDVLSRVLHGARPTAIAGAVGGILILSIGMTIGVTAGYVGGLVDDVLMRLTDLAYGVPIIPFAIVLLSFIGIGFLNSVIVIGLLLWRGNARVLRAQVLQIKERPFILAVRSTGASAPRIVLKHILPNIAPMAVLFLTLGIGYSIILQASLAFLGVSNPFVPSWGIMIRNVYRSGYLADAWWWTIPPGVLLSATVLAAFMLGRRYEEISGEVDDDAFVNAG